MADCRVCHSQLKKDQKVYCSNRCQSLERYNLYIESWKSGKKDGGRGILAKNISGHIRRYLEGKFGEKCSSCGWSSRNPLTNRVPLEVDHLNGDAEDNREDNLRLICPNCHALSPNFRNLNKGHGRAWRMAKYKKNLTQ